MLLLLFFWMVGLFLFSSFIAVCIAGIVGIIDIVNRIQKHRSDTARGNYDS